MRSRRVSSSHGWSGYGGQPLGAYYPQQDPSGSSSGSAIAASIGLALGALAAETSGSIVLPAEHNNVVGIKPTLGLMSRSMVIPISLRQDTVGPVARTVKDAAYILSVISGTDKFDNWTDAQPFDEIPDYVKACKYSAFSGARLGIPRNGITPFLNQSTEPIMAAFETAVELIRDAGATVVDEANFASFDIDAFGRNSSIVLGTDFVAQLSDYLSQLTKNPNNVHNLHDTRYDPQEEWPDRDIGFHSLSSPGPFPKLTYPRSMSGTESSNATTPTNPKSPTMHTKPTSKWRVPRRPRHSRQIQPRCLGNANIRILPSSGHRRFARCHSSARFLPG